MPDADNTTSYKCPVNLPDLQNEEDTRGVEIDRVGITNVKFPIKVRRKPSEPKKHEYDEVSADVRLFVGLPHNYKGVNMSRFTECLVEFSRHTISMSSMPDLLISLQEKLKSKDAYARFEFDYYIDKTAPVSKKTAPMAYRCAFTGIKRNGTTDFILEVNVIAASLCPCSRGMSLLEQESVRDEIFKERLELELNEEHKIILQSAGRFVGMGAHNQRSQIRVQVICKEKEFLWIEDLVDLIEAQASAPTYPILKRPDEKFVTEQAYNNAKFSEDIARDIHLALQLNEKIEVFSVKVRNEESIHPYDCVSYTHSSNWKYSNA
jgi:GTP cyclohydrolase I